SVRSKLKEKILKTVARLQRGFRRGDKEWQCRPAGPGDKVGRFDVGITRWSGKAHCPEGAPAHYRRGITAGGRRGEHELNARKETAGTQQAKHFPEKCAYLCHNHVSRCAPHSRR